MVARDVWLLASPPLCRDSFPLLRVDLELPKRLGKQDPEDASAWSKFDDDEPRKGKILYKKFKIGLRLDFPDLFLSLALEFFKPDEDEG